MSKSFYNVVNPDYIVDNYGADTLRMYEMFLGPLEQSKPWDTNGIDGVHKFLRRFWRLFFDRDGQLCVTDEKATEQELRTLHKTIKKVSEDIENFSFNTSVAAFMICLNELGECSKREVLEPLTVLLAPFAPHIAEELWAALGHAGLRRDAPRAELVRIPRVGQRQAPLPEGVCRFDDARRDSGRRRHGPRGAEMARRQNPEKDHRRAGQDHKHRDLTPRHA